MKNYFIAKLVANISESACRTLQHSYFWLSNQFNIFHRQYSL